MNICHKTLKAHLCSYTFPLKSSSQLPLLAGTAISVFRDAEDSTRPERMKKIMQKCKTRSRATSTWNHNPHGFRFECDKKKATRKKLFECYWNKPAFAKLPRRRSPAKVNPQQSLRSRDRTIDPPHGASGQARGLCCSISADKQSLGLQINHRQQLAESVMSDRSPLKFFLAGCHREILRCWRMSVLLEETDLKRSDIR